MVPTTASASRMPLPYAPPSTARSNVNYAINFIYGKGVPQPSRPECQAGPREPPSRGERLAPRPLRDHLSRAPLALLLTLLVTVPAASAVALCATPLQVGPSALPASAFATHPMPPAPWYTGPTYGRDFASLADVPAAPASVTPTGMTAATGTAKVLALAIDFTDVKHC